MKKAFLLITLLTLSLMLLTNTAFAKAEKGIRLSLGAAPGLNEVEFSGSGGTYPVGLNDESGVNFNPTFVIRPRTEKGASFVGAFGLFVRNQTGEDNVGEEVELSTFGISVAPGLAINLSERAHLEFKAELGLGRSEQSSTVYDEEGSGPYFSFGVSAGSYFNVSDHVVLGGDIGYMAFVSEGELDVGPEVVDVEYSGDGVTLNLSLGFIF